MNDIGKYVKLDEFKNKLLGSISHKLTTPITNIEGNLELAIVDCQDKSIRSRLKNVKVASTVLLSSVKDLLDFSLLSQKNLKLNTSVFILYELIESISKNIKRIAKIKGLQYILDYSVSKSI